MSGLILHKNRAFAGNSIGYDLIDDVPLEANLYSENWVRPADWISVPDPSVGSEVVYMLYGVDEQHSNYLTIRASGTFSVDWGDGTSEIVSSGGYSRKEYSFSSINPSAQTSEGFRCVLVTVTPVYANTLTSFSLQEYHSYWTRRDRINILEMKVSAPYMSSFNVGNSVNDNNIQQTDRMRRHRRPIYVRKLPFFDGGLYIEYRKYNEYGRNVPVLLQSPKPSFDFGRRLHHNAIYVPELLCAGRISFDISVFQFAEYLLHVL